MYQYCILFLSKASQSGGSVPGGPQVNHQAEIDSLRAEYEAKLSSLQEQYGTEHANRTRLEQEMISLKSEYESQIAEAKVCMIHVHVYLFAHTYTMKRSTLISILYYLL